METNQKTAWQTMGYSWRDGNGIVEIRRTLALVDPFARAATPYHTLAGIARTLTHLGR